MDGAGGGKGQLGEERMAVDALRVLIAAADPLARAGLRALVSAEPGFEVVADMGIDVDETAVPTASAPDVLLADMGEGELADVLSTLASTDLPVLALVPHSSAGRAALGAGARGALVRTADGARIAAALRAVAAGLQVSEPVQRVLDDPLDHAVEHPVEEMTPRENEVLQLLAAGLSNKAIAHRLRISEHTVKFHVTAIMGKLGTHSRTETVTRAARAGLIVL